MDVVNTTVMNATTAAATATTTPTAAAVSTSSSLSLSYQWGFWAGRLCADLVHRATTHCWSFFSFRDAVATIGRFPKLYTDWWWHLAFTDPIHVFVETVLLVFIGYIWFFCRSTSSTSTTTKDGGGRRRSRHRDDHHHRERLTTAEREEILRDWKENFRKPLTPPVGDEHHQHGVDQGVVVHQFKGKYMNVSTSNDHERTAPAANLPLTTDASLRTVLNFATFDFLGLSASMFTTDYNKGESSEKNSQDEEEEGNNDDSKSKSQDRTCTKRDRETSDTNNEEGGDGDEDDDSSLANNDETEKHGGRIGLKPAAIAALNKYGCGSCGPRGFYGTVDVHLELERAFAAFCGTQSAILYSDGASTVSSTIAAFCKRGDLLVVDEAVYEPIVTGVTLSRAHVKWFKHNDVEDLRRVLEKVRAQDVLLGRKSNAQRRFIVVEGLYRQTGSVVPLDRVVQLKHEYCYRLILDESHSFGTVAARGVTERYGCQIGRDAEIVTVSLEYSMAGVGGVCVGPEAVVDHQRLSGSGYCFSASSPPFTAASTMAALELLKSSPETTIRKLHSNIAYANQRLRQLLQKREFERFFAVTSDPRSPLVFLSLRDDCWNNEQQQLEVEDGDVAREENRYSLDQVVFFRRVARECLQRGVAFCVARPPTLQGQLLGPDEQQQGAAARSAGQHGRRLPVSGIRMAVSAALEHQDIDHALRVLEQALDVVASPFLRRREGEEEQSM